MNAQIKKTDKAKLSQIGKVAKSTTKSTTKGTTKGKWRILVWTVFLLLAAIALSAVLVWFFRFALAENRIRAALAKHGFEVALKLDKLSLDQAVVDNIKIEKNGNVVFTAKRIIVDYDLGKQGPDRLQKLALQSPVAKISFNTDGTIESPWFGSGTGGPLLLPTRGISIEDARLDWTLMHDNVVSGNVVLGSGITQITTEIHNARRWSAQLLSENTDFTADGLGGVIQHDILLNTKDGMVFEISGTASSTGFSAALSPGNVVFAHSLASEFKINFVRGTDMGAPSLSGTATIKADTLDTKDYQVGGGDIRIDLDKAARAANGRPVVSAGWQIALQRFRVKDRDRRQQLADQLTAHSLLSNTPIAKEFTRVLMGKAEGLLNGFDLQAQGHYHKSAGGYKVRLHRPLHMKASGDAPEHMSGHTPGQSAIFTPHPNTDFVVYNLAAQTLDVRADVDWTGVQALEVKGLSLRANSVNGLGLDSIAEIKAKFHSLRNWRLHNDGREIRLAPFDLDFAYTNTGSNTGKVRMGGRLDYDGPVPGGFVRGLKSDGEINLQLNQGDFTLGFTPTAPISLTEFSNRSGWTAKDLQFNLRPQDKLLQKTNNGRAQSHFMGMVLENVVSGLVGPQGERHLDAKLGRLGLVVDFSKSPQHWRMKIKDTDIKSENFPAPGTHIASPDGTLDVYMDGNGGMTFEAFSPLTRVKTDNLTAENMDLQLSGSPDNINAKYEIERAVMVGDGLPALPVKGTARLINGVLTGQAITNIPGTTDTPINIDFRSKHGRGTAKINIPNISFEPNGLQPQHLVPVLRGRLADVSGDISAAFDFEFGGGQPVRSKGSAELKGLNIGTLVGPVSGIDAHITLSSVYPLQTDGIQRATISGFDPGFPLKDGRIKFEINPGGFVIHQAEWPILNIDGANIEVGQSKTTPGKIFLAPTNWRFGDFENRVVVHVQDIELATILSGIGKDKLSATGLVSGVLPARINGVNVVIDDGVLGIKDGGVIRYTSAGTEAAAAQNENAGYAFQALRNFKYKQLEARIDGPLDGAMALRIVFDGNNPEILSGQPFVFDTTITGDLANLARNMTGAFSTRKNLSRILEVRDNETNPK